LLKVALKHQISNQSWYYLLLDKGTLKHDILFNWMRELSNTRCSSDALLKTDGNMWTLIWNIIYIKLTHILYIWISVHVLLLLSVDLICK
jgi:hypothetical protein